jgi:hypothetical protein
MNDKLLALNVPTDFIAHVNFARREIMPQRKPSPEMQGTLPLGDNTSERPVDRRMEKSVMQRYQNCFRHLGIDPNATVGNRLLEIECRFVALLKTVDHSVPVAPLWRKFSGLGRTIERHCVSQVERDYVVRSRGYKDASQVPHSMDDFRNASSLEEKAMIADLITEDFRKDIAEIAQHFHYKRNMFGRGASRTYSLLYAVLALSYEFDTHNTLGKMAGVTLSADGSGHEGAFLRFVVSFVTVADTGNQNHRPTEGLNERVRKIAQKRNVDPELITLLDQNAVDAATMLTFMERADALKA